MGNRYTKEDMNDRFNIDCDQARSIITQKFTKRRAEMLLQRSHGWINNMFPEGGRRAPKRAVMEVKEVLGVDLSCCMTGRKKEYDDGQITFDEYENKALIPDDMFTADDWADLVEEANGSRPVDNSLVSAINRLALAIETLNTKEWRITIS